MDAIEVLTTRASIPKLGEPAPRPDEVETILRAALRAPDHGLLRPWRFLTIEGDARNRLGAVLADTLRASAPDTPEEALENTRAKPLRAPLIIVVVATVDAAHPKIPEIEQVVSAAAAAQNIVLAVHALGYASYWRTGQPAYDAGVKGALGLEASDHIIGFIYIGTATEPAPRKRRPELPKFVQAWDG